MADNLLGLASSGWGFGGGFGAPALQSTKTPEQFLASLNSKGLYQLATGNPMLLYGQMPYKAAGAGVTYADVIKGAKEVPGPFDSRMQTRGQSTYTFNGKDVTGIVNNSADALKFFKNPNKDHPPLDQLGNAVMNQSAGAVKPDPTGRGGMVTNPDYAGADPILSLLADRFHAEHPGFTFVNQSGIGHTQVNDQDKNVVNDPLFGAIVDSRYLKNPHNDWWSNNGVYVIGALSGIGIGATALAGGSLAGSGSALQAGTIGTAGVGGGGTAVGGGAVGSGAGTLGAGGVAAGGAAAPIEGGTNLFADGSIPGMNTAAGGAPAVAGGIPAAAPAALSPSIAGPAQSLSGPGSGLLNTAGTVGSLVGGGGGSTLGSLIGVGGSLLGGYLNSQAAQTAAQQQVDAQNRAIDVANAQYQQTRADLAPYRDVGAGAIGTLGGMMNSGYFHPFGLQDFYGTPGGAPPANSTAGQSTVGQFAAQPGGREQPITAGNAGARGMLYAGGSATFNEMAPPVNTRNQGGRMYPGGNPNFIEGQTPTSRGGLMYPGGSANFIEGQTPGVRTGKPMMGSTGAANMLYPGGSATFNEMAGGNRSTLGQVNPLPAAPGRQQAMSVGGFVANPQSAPSAAQSAFNVQNTPFYGNSYADPGYAFRQNQGEQAINRTLAARGMSGSGNALMELTKYNNDLASQEFGNAYTRFTGDQSRMYGNWSGLAGMGQNAAAQMGSFGQANANTVGGLLSGIGASQSAGTIGGSNAYNNAISQGLNWYQNQSVLDALKNQNKTSNPNYSPGTNF